MYEHQEIVPVTKENLHDHVAKMVEEGFRLVQMSCVQGEDFQIDYSFDKDQRFVNLRLHLPTNHPQINSISTICAPAFLYENELHDLFGIQIDGMIVDYKGKFYRLETKTPFKSEHVQTDSQEG